MTEDNNTKRPEPIVLKEIPDSWGRNGHCPACQKAPLQVVHLANATDYLICNHCELSFEVAVSGSKIRVKNVSEDLGFMEGELRYRWVEPAALGEFFANRIALIQERNKRPTPGVLSNQEVRDRSISLYKMGNKPKMVEFILMQSGATPEQAHAELLRLKQHAERDAKKQVRKFWVAGAILFFVVFAFVAGWLSIPSLISAQLTQRLANPGGPATQPSLFVQALNILPDLVKPRYLKSATAQVRYVGPDHAQCPVRSSDAAALFGGQANSWTRITQFAGWEMMGTGGPSTIRVPQDMQAAFLDDRSGTFSRIIGSATISNINFVSIFCK